MKNQAQLELQFLGLPVRVENHRDPRPTNPTNIIVHRGTYPTKPLWKFIIKVKKPAKNAKWNHYETHGCGFLFFFKLQIRRSTLQM